MNLRTNWIFLSTVLLAFSLSSCNKITEPTVSIISTSKITNKSATIAVSVSADGGGDVSQRGVVFSTLPEPNLNNTQVQEGSGLGNFEVLIGGLENSTTYHVRAYASNEAGDAYSEEITFTTSDIKTIEIGNFTYGFHKDAFIGDHIWGDDGLIGAGGASDGQGNTTTIAAIGDGFAASKCSKLSIGGFDDWYLPAVDELKSFSNYQQEIGILRDGTYWSSTEDSDPEGNLAYVYTFDEQFEGSYSVPKNQDGSCLCVRKD